MCVPWRSPRHLLRCRAIITMMLRRTTTRCRVMPRRNHKNVIITLRPTYFPPLVRLQLCDRLSGVFAIYRGCLTGEQSLVSLATLAAVAVLNNWLPRSERLGTSCAERGAGASADDDDKPAAGSCLGDRAARTEACAGATPPSAWPRPDNGNRGSGVGSCRGDRTLFFGAAGSCLGAWTSGSAAGSCLGVWTAGSGAGSCCGSRRPAVPRINPPAPKRRNPCSAGADAAAAEDAEPISGEGLQSGMSSFSRTTLPTDPKGTSSNSSFMVVPSLSLPSPTPAVFSRFT